MLGHTLPIKMQGNARSRVISHAQREIGKRAELAGWTPGCQSRGAAGASEADDTKKGKHRHGSKGHRLEESDEELREIHWGIMGAFRAGREVTDGVEPRCGGNRSGLRRKHGLRGLMDEVLPVQDKFDRYRCIAASGADGENTLAIGKDR